MVVVVRMKVEVEVTVEKEVVASQAMGAVMSTVSTSFTWH